MLCRVAAVKSLPVHHQSACYFLWDPWAHPGENRNRLNRRLEGSGGREAGRMQPRKLQCCIWIKRLNQPESPIFVIFVCSLFPKAILFYFHYFLYRQHIYGIRPTYPFSRHAEILRRPAAVHTLLKNQTKQSMQRLDIWMIYQMLIMNILNKCWYNLSKRTTVK